MSVILFDAQELGNAAAYLTASRRCTDEQRRDVAEHLATYSVGNAWAYSRQYHEGTQPVSVSEILSYLDLRRFNHEQAKGTLRLLSYNGVTNAGQETALQGYHEALARIMALAFERVMSEQDAARDAA